MTRPTPFLADRVGPVCAPGLLKDRGKFHLAELRRCTLLSADTRPDAWADWAQSRRVDLDPRKARPFEHTYFMLEAAASGLGIGIASHPLVEDDLRSGRLVALFGFTASGRSYCALHARTLADNPKIAAFRSWITGRKAAVS